MSCLTGLTVTEATLLLGPEELEDPEAFLSLVTLTEAMVTGHWRASCLVWPGQGRGKGYRGLKRSGCQERRLLQAGPGTRERGGDECKPRQLAWGNQADPPGANSFKIAEMILKTTVYSIHR